MRLKQLSRFSSIALSTLWFACGSGSDGHQSPAPDAGNLEDAAPGSDGAPIEDAAPGRDGSPLQDAGPDDDAAPTEDAAPSTVEVSGTLSVGEVPSAGRIIIIRGNDGKLQTTLSKAQGKFSFQGVELPYDIGVPAVGQPEEDTLSGNYFLGLTQTKPYITENPTAPPPFTTHTLKVETSFPACQGQPCSVSYRLYSNVSSQNAFKTVAVGATSANDTDIEFVALPSTTSLQLYVVLTNKDDQFAYVARHIPFSGESTLTDTAILSAVPTLAVSTFTGIDDAIDPSWQRNLSVSVGLPGRPLITLLGVAARTGSVLVPNIPGGELGVKFFMHSPDFSWTVESEVEGLPLTTTNYDLALVKHAEFITPTAAEGTFSIASDRFRWNKPVASGTVNILSIQGGAGHSLSIATEEEEISLERLRALNIAPFEAGPHELFLMGMEPVTIDDLATKGFTQAQPRQVRTRGYQTVHVDFEP